MSRNWFVPLILAAAFAAALVAQPNTSPPDPTPATKPPAADTQHSKLVLQQTPFSFLDPVFGTSVAAFESVPDSASPADKLLYLSPLSQPVPFDPDGKVRFQCLPLGNGVTQFSFRLANYYDGMFAEAAGRINLRHKTNFEGRQIALMPVSMVVYSIRLPGTGLELTDVVGSLDEYQSLPKVTTVQFQVPDAHADLVKKLADSDGGLRISSKLMFNAIGLKRRVESWTVEDVRNTTLGRSINSGGAAFYAVQAFEEMMNQIGGTRNWMQYEDPGLPDTIKTEARAMFDKIALASGELVIVNLADARAADEALRRGQGLNAAQFQPVTIWFNYTQDVLSQTRYEEANKKAEEYFDQKQTSLSVSAKASYGPISGRATYNQSTNRWEHRKYESQREFEDFQRTHRTEDGKGVRFEARGLGLVEKGQLKNHLSMTVTSVTLRPVSLAGKLTVASTIGAGSTPLRGPDGLVQEMATAKADIVALRAELVVHKAESAQARASLDGKIDRNYFTLDGKIDRNYFGQEKLIHEKVSHGNGVNINIGPDTVFRIHADGATCIINTKTGKVVRWFTTIDG